MQNLMYQHAPGKKRYNSESSLHMGSDKHLHLCQICLEIQLACYVLLGVLTLFQTLAYVSAVKSIAHYVSQPTEQF